MTFKYFLKFVLLPLVVIAAVIFLIFNKPIIRYFSFDRTFDKLVAHRGEAVATDYADQIIQMGAEAEEPLIRRYQNSTKLQDKYYALYLLGRIGGGKGAPVILEALRHESPSVRWGAVRGLKYMMKPEYVSAVKPLLGDPVREVRYDAAATLGRANSPESLRALYELAGRERDSYVWFRAWLSLRYLMPVDGPVVEKIRYNKSMQQIPAEEVNIEAGYTYFPTSPSTCRAKCTRKSRLATGWSSLRNRRTSRSGRRRRNNDPATASGARAHPPAADPRGDPLPDGVRLHRRGGRVPDHHAPDSGAADPRLA